MTKSATARQKKFLKALGCSSTDGLTIDSASKLIDKLLADEKASGRKFPCPYCKEPFGPRPKRTKKCPSCKQTITHLTGRFLTDVQVSAIDQKEWLKDERSDNKFNVKEDWRDEKAYRREFSEVSTVGYMLHIGKTCKQSIHLDKRLVRIEDAYDYPRFLPPYDSCKHDTCNCSYESKFPSQLTKSVKIVESDDASVLAKLKTRQNSTATRKVDRKNKGCLGVLAISLLIVLVGIAKYAV